MIVAERKPFEEIQEMLQGHKKVLVVGCGTCVAVCLAGGEKEVGVLASELRLAAGATDPKVEVEIIEDTVLRQCDKEYVEPLAEKIEAADVVLSTACGVGVQFLAEQYPEAKVRPGLNTRFMGSNEDAGVWMQRCLACGDCILAETGGVCPVTICAKGLQNGPCGGTKEGKCEVAKDKDCAWTLIYNRLEMQGGLDKIRRIFPPKDHSHHTHPARFTHPAFATEE